jgi:hypothetical protein
MGRSGEEILGKWGSRLSPVAPTLGNSEKSTAERPLVRGSIEPPRVFALLNRQPFGSLSGDTSRKGILRTLRLGDAGFGDSEGSEATPGQPFVCVPGVIAGEIDVLPSERGDMLK